MFSVVQAMQHASSLQAKGRLSDAEKSYNQILAQAPDHHPAYHAWGLLALETDRLPLAVALVAQAALLAPDVFLYQRNLGEMYRRLGRLAEAISAGLRVTELVPNDLDAHYNLGLALADAERYEEAIASYRRALDLNPKHGLSWNNMGSALENSGNNKAAMEAYAAAIDIDPSHAEAQNNLGSLYTEQGKLEEAIASFNKAIDCNPQFVEAHHNLSTLKKYSTDDPHLAHLQSIVNHAHQLDVPRRIRFHFALGKAFEDTRQFDRAFSSYAVGNRLQHALLPHNETSAQQTVDKLVQSFSRAFIESWKTTRRQQLDSDRVPIFIVGMPRSGTTLIEQVISSHPDVYGAGELPDLDQVISEYSNSVSSPFPEWLDKAPEEAFFRLGRRYLDRVWKQAPNTRFITDKMPANFFHTGMIYCMFPDARIIHSIRDPMDSCLSCYTKHFKQTMEFTYDLETIGRYYVRYKKLMRHWQQVLPENTILDVRYEDTIADFDQQARRILEYVGLPWDDQVLKFYENKRLVKTASVQQVRQPIYSSSVARWTHFGRNLDPLLEIVKDFR